MTMMTVILLMKMILMATILMTMTDDRVLHLSKVAEVIMVVVLLISLWQLTSVIFVNENENGEQRENNEFVNKN